MALLRPQACMQDTLSSLQGLVLRAVGASREWLVSALDRSSVLTAEYRCGDLRIGGVVSSQCFPLRARKDFPEEASWLTRVYLTW